MLNHPIIITLCQATKYNFKPKTNLQKNYNKAGNQ